MSLNIHTAVLVAYVEQQLGTPVADHLKEVITEERALENANSNAMTQARKLLQRIAETCGDDDNLGLCAQDIVDQLEPARAPKP